MNKIVKITIDNRECLAPKNKYLIEVARDNNIYIPTLCNIPGLKPKGACRICTVKINNKFMTACTTPVSEGMVIECETAELDKIRKDIIELLFIEGNHFCPTCEKSGNCELQALAYKYKVMAPKYPYQFPTRAVDASHALLLLDHNRCILCKRCIRGIKDENGQSIFAFRKRGPKVEINIDPDQGKKITPKLAQQAMKLCPVGAILVKEKGFKIPIGKRKYDKISIENQQNNL